MRKGPMLAAAAALLTMPAAAHADTVITAQTIWRWSASTYDTTAGDKVQFFNDDLLSPGPHNVTSEGVANGKALFSSKTGGYRSGSPVANAENLPAGSYPFICTVHPFMKATLKVNAKPAPPADTTAPKLEAKIRSSSRTTVLKSGRLRVQLSSDEPVHFAVTVSSPRGKGSRSLAKRFAFAHDGGPLVVQVPVSGAAKTLLRTRKRVAVRVTLRAKDAAGNLTVATATRTLT